MGKKLPESVHELSGNHKTAIDRTADIHRYVDQAYACLSQAYEKDIGALLRAGLLRQGDDYLDTVIRFANCAKDELRIAYCREP